MSQNAILDATLAWAAAITWQSGQTFLDTGRRLKAFDKAIQPALFLVDGIDIHKTSEMPTYQTLMKANLVVLHRAGVDQAAIPSVTSNDIVDAIVTKFRPLPAIGKLTLGGLVHRAFIDGTIIKDNDDLGGQSVIVIPLTIILP